MTCFRRDFLKATGMLGMAAFVAACKSGSIARTSIDAGVPDTKGMGSNLRTWARNPEKTDLMMLADRPPLLETPLHYFLQDLTPNEAYFVRWHYAGVPTHIDLRTFRTAAIGAVDGPLQLSFDDLRTKFEPVTMTAFSQCSGNSRSFFLPRVRCRTSGQVIAKCISIKGTGCKFGGCALKAVSLIAGDLLHVPESGLRVE